MLNEAVVLLAILSVGAIAFVLYQNVRSAPGSKKCSHIKLVRKKGAV